MPQIGRLGDIGSGHGSRPSTPTIEGSPDVFVNGRALHRQGDALAPHGCKTERRMAGGSPSVYVNGKPASRMGDRVNCGGVLVTAAPDTYADELTPRKLKAVFAAGGPCVRECMKAAARQGKAFVG